MKKISEKTVDYSVYRNGTTYLGTASVDLPSIEFLSETIKGAGIAGEMESPTIGHTSAMSLTINWRTVTPEAVGLIAPESHALDFRAVVQVYDPTKGEYNTVQEKISVRAMPKSLSIGKLEAGATMDSSNEFSVNYLKILHDGKEVLEIDKINYVFRVNGKDYLANIKTQLGL